MITDLVSSSMRFLFDPRVPINRGAELAGTMKRRRSLRRGVSTIVVQPVLYGTTSDT